MRLQALARFGRACSGGRNRWTPAAAGDPPSSCAPHQTQTTVLRTTQKVCSVIICGCRWNPGPAANHRQKMGLGACGVLACPNLSGGLSVHQRCHGGEALLRLCRVDISADLSPAERPARTTIATLTETICSAAASPPPLPGAPSKRHMHDAAQQVTSVELAARGSASCPKHGAATPKRGACHKPKAWCCTPGSRPTALARPPSQTQPCAPPVT